MRTLEWDEVLGLEKFLVEDNDEAIGIEVHLGIRICNHEFTEPETIKKFSIEELANGDLIEIPDRTLCALVGDRIYYRDIYNNVNHISPESLFGYYCDSTKRHLILRVKVQFGDQIVILTDEEILALKTILVKDNERVSGIEIMRGYMGIGGSNRSDFEITGIATYTLYQLNGAEPIRVGRSEICAVVNDVLYCRSEEENGKKRVYTMNFREKEITMSGDSIAYDTVSAAKVSFIK